MVKKRFEDGGLNWRKSMLKSFESKGLNFVRKHRGVVQDETGPALTIPALWLQRNDCKKNWMS